MEKYNSDLSTIKYVGSLLSNYQASLAQGVILKYLEKYGDDPFGLHLLVRSYIMTQEYDTALSLLEEKKVLDNDNKILILDLISLYIKLGMEDKVYEMYSSSVIGLGNYTRGFNDSVNYKQMDVYLKSLFDDQFSVSRKDIYSLRILNKYSSESVIRKIKTNHVDVQSKSSFINMDISLLYDRVKNFVNNHPYFGSLCLPVYDEYYFRLNDCGVCNHVMTDYFRAVTVVNTPNIVTMMPVLPNSSIYYHDISMKRRHVKVKK